MSNITNTLFPPPPGYYKAFTPEAVERVAAAREEGTEAEVVSNDPELEPLRPPRADWVLEDGRWMLFGQMYTAEPHIPTAKDIGLPPIVADAQGRDQLPTLLHSFLHTLLAFIDTLTTTARTPDELNYAGRPHEGDQYIQHLSNLAAAMMVSANQLRGVQAEATLVMVMERQVEERKRQTEALRAKSREVALTIRRLKGIARDAQKGEGGAEKSESEGSRVDSLGVGLQSRIVREPSAEVAPAVDMPAVTVDEPEVPAAAAGEPDATASASPAVVETVAGAEGGGETMTGVEGGGEAGTTEGAVEGDAQAGVEAEAPDDGDFQMGE